METANFALPTIILQPRESITKDNIDQAQESLSHVCAAITDILASEGIVYNLLIANKGMSFYITPRKKDSELSDNIFRFGIFDIAGVFVTWKKDFFEKLKFKDFFNFCKEKVALKKEEVAKLKSLIVQKLESEYKGISNT